MKTTLLAAALLLLNSTAHAEQRYCSAYVLKDGKVVCEEVATAITTGRIPFVGRDDPQPLGPNQSRTEYLTIYRDRDGAPTGTTSTTAITTLPPR